MLWVEYKYNVSNGSLPRLTRIKGHCAQSFYFIFLFFLNLSLNLWHVSGLFIDTEKVAERVESVQRLHVTASHAE